MAIYTEEDSLTSETLPKTKCIDEPFAATQARDDHTTFSSSPCENGIAESLAENSAFAPASEDDLASAPEETEDIVQQERGAGATERRRTDVATQVSRHGSPSPEASSDQTKCITLLVFGSIVTIVAGVCIDNWMSTQRDIEIAKLENERQFKVLQKEQNEIEQVIAELNHQREMKNLSIEELEKRYKHEEKMFLLEGERKKNDTALEVYKQLLLPRTVTRKKVDSGIFSTSTEYYEETEVAYNKLPSDVKQIVGANTGHHQARRDNPDDEDDRDAI